MPYLNPHPALCPQNELDAFETTCWVNEHWPEAQRVLVIGLINSPNPGYLYRCAKSGMSGSNPNPNPNPD